MPNYSCERCDLKVCRVSCRECYKYVCEDCRIVNRKQYVCNACHSRRIIPTSSAKITINHTNTAWWGIIEKTMQEIYVAAGSPKGITLVSASIVEYVKSENSPVSYVIRDKYTRIRNHYYLVRSFYLLNDARYIVRKNMFVSDDFKRELAEKSMHPDRLQYWMDQGWEDYWDDYF